MTMVFFIASARGWGSWRLVEESPGSSFQSSAISLRLARIDGLDHDVRPHRQARSNSWAAPALTIVRSNCLRCLRRHGFLP